VPICHRVPLGRRHRDNSCRRKLQLTWIQLELQTSCHLNLAVVPNTMHDLLVLSCLHIVHKRALRNPHTVKLPMPTVKLPPAVPVPNLCEASGAKFELDLMVFARSLDAPQQEPGLHTPEDTSS
jgi:hypothetical protein